MSDKDAVDLVENLIEEIGYVEYDEACREKMEAARAAYDVLTDAQKVLVTNYNVLTDAELTYARTEADMAREETNAAKAELEKAWEEAEAARKVAEEAQAKTEAAENAAAEAEAKAKAAEAAQKAAKSNFKGAKNVIIKSGKTTVKQLKKLKSGKKYFFRMKAYKAMDGKLVYTSYSTKKNVKVK